MKNSTVYGALLCLMACTSEPSKIERISDLVGTWEMITKDGVIYEVWEKVNENEMAGHSFMIAGTDTIPFESVRLLEEAGKLSYIPTVSDQNEGKPVAFKEEKWTEDGIIFANPDHDFPQQISYQWITKDSLIAEISGMEQGKPKKETYPFSRKKS